MGNLTTIEMLVMSIQAEMQRLRDDIEEAVSVAHIAKNLPRYGSIDEDRVHASFDVKESDASTLTLRRGVVAQLGRGLLACEELSCNVSGTKSNPCRIVLKWKLEDDTFELYDSASEPTTTDDGTYRYIVLYEAYLASNPERVVISFDRRSDVRLGSPL